MALHPYHIYPTHNCLAPPSATVEEFPRPLRLVIIERDPMARRGLGQVLAASMDMSVTGTVSTIQEATYLPASTPVDVVLVGDDVVDMDGMQGILQLLTRFLFARVVVLVAEGSPEQIVGALRQGADGVLPRDIPPRDLTSAVRGVVQEKVALPRRWVRFLTDALRLGPLTAHVDNVSLSPRERDVLSEIALGRSNAEIGYRLGLKESTVKTHVSSILAKTGARSRYALYAPQRHAGRTA